MLVLVRYWTRSWTIGGSVYVLCSVEYINLLLSKEVKNSFDLEEPELLEESSTQD